MGFTTEKKLRRFFREAAEKRLGRTWRCPTESKIAAYFDGNIAGRDRERMEAHLARCAPCREQLAFLARPRGAASPEAVPEDWLARAGNLVEAPRKIAPGGNWRWAAAVAATVCVLLVAVVVLRRPARRQPSASLPGTSPASGLRGIAAPSSAPALTSPIPGAVLNGRGLEFRWTPVRGGVEYRVSVLTADGNIVWQQDTEGTSATLPAGVRLLPGEKYFVWVRASLRGGNSARSKAVPFSVMGAR